MARRIELRHPDAQNSNSYRAIFVDDVCWGHVIMWHRGPHGFYVTFEDSQYNTIMKTDRIEFKLWSDKHALRHAKQGETVHKFAVRLETTLHELVTTDQLRDPAELAAHQKELLDEEQRDRLTQDGLIVGSAEVRIESFMQALTFESTNDLRKRLVNLMKWTVESDLRPRHFRQIEGERDESTASAA